MNRSVGRWALLLGCLLFAVAGQLYFAKRPEYFWDGALLYAVAALCFVLLSRPAPAPQAADAPAARRTREDWLRLGLTAAGIFFGALAVLRLRTPQKDYWPIFWTWLAGMTLCFAATLPRPKEGFASLRKTFVGMAWEPLVVLALFGMALVLRVWRIDTIPWTLSGDEGNFGRWAREALDGRLVNMFSTGHLSMPSLYAFFQAAFLKLSDDMVGLRLPWAIMGALSVLGTYLLVRRLFGRNLAILTTLLLAGYSYHIHYSRLGLNNIADPFFVVWALYFFVLGWQSGRKWPWMVAGLLSGLAFYFYTGGRQVPVILLGVILWAALTERDFLKRSRSGLIALVIGFVVSVGPMALYATQHPDDFNARMNQVGIIQTGWLEREAQARAVSKLVVLLEQFRQVFFGFTTFLDRTDFYRPNRPLLDFPAAILFLLGVVLSVTRVIDRRALTGPHPSTPSGPNGGPDSAQDAIALREVRHTGPDSAQDAIALREVRHTGPDSAQDAIALREVRHTGPDSAQDAIALRDVRHTGPDSAQDAIALRDVRHTGPDSAQDALPVVGEIEKHPERSSAVVRAAESKDAGVARPSWRYALFVIWFFGVIIAGGVLTDNAPSSQRIVSSSIPAMFFVAVALREIARAFASLTGLPRLGRQALALAVAALLVVSGARYYFGPYQQSMVYGSFNGEVSTAIGYYMQRLGPDWKQYFFGAPRMWAQFGSATFISKNPYLDVVDPLAGPPTFVDPAYNAAFIILPDRMLDLEWIRQAYPDGQLEEVHRNGDADAPLLFTAYTVRTKSSG